MLCLVRVQGWEWEGEREGREVTSPAVSPTGHSGNTAFLAQYLVAQRDIGKLSWFFILPKQLDHIKGQQLKDVFSNQIIQCL